MLLLGESGSILLYPLDILCSLFVLVLKCLLFVIFVLNTLLLTCKRGYTVDGKWFPHRDYTCYCWLAMLLLSTMHLNADLESCCSLSNKFERIFKMRAYLF